MPLYYLHLRDGSDELLDPDGVTMPVGAIEGMALKAARDCIAGDAQNGRIDLKHRIDVEDEAGAIVYSIAFADAVEVFAAPA